jgi:hypothetical protein
MPIQIDIMENEILAELYTSARRLLRQESARVK